YSWRVTSPSRSSDGLATRILLGLAIGLTTGGLVRIVSAGHPQIEPAARWLAEQVLDPFGQVFLRLLFFAVVPLVFASLASGVVQLARLDKLGLLAVRTFLLLAINFAACVALGLLVLNLLEP